MRNYTDNNQINIQIINEKQLSQLLGRSLSAIRKDRLSGKGISYIKYAENGKVLYDLKDIETYLLAHKRNFTTEDTKNSSAHHDDAR